MKPFPIELVTKLLDLRDQFFKQTIFHHKFVVKHGAFIEVERCQVPDEEFKKTTILNPFLKIIGRAFSLLKFELRRLGVPPNMRQSLANKLVGFADTPHFSSASLQAGDNLGNASHHPSTP